MRLKFKLALLGLGATIFDFAILGSDACARFWGDFLGDALFLSMID
ncbi:MAG: hypothetical protein KKI02_11775 [Planctomycetes bacterium]|nr:hypothetical protein [Planctomycetota bacterium]